jgi:transcriptional regulator with XRE-family HTH domain
LGKRVHDLRSAKKWSQEEFAHISGLHRTYIGQIERGEKNISFGNLSKIAGVLGVTLSELLAGIEDGGSLDTEAKRTQELGSHGTIDAARQMLEIQRLTRRLRLQRDAMDQTILGLEALAARSTRTPRRSSERTASRRGASKK